MSSTYVQLILLVSIIPGSTPLNCPSFPIQGSIKERTVIRLIGNGIESVGLEIDNRLTAYEWNIWTRFLSTAGDVCLTSTRGHVPCYLHAWKSAGELHTKLQESHNVIRYDEDGRSLIIKNEWINPNMCYTIELKVIKFGQIVDTHCIEILNTNLVNVTEMENPIKRNKLELILIGPEYTYCNIKSIINAVVVGNYTNAIFKWSIKENPSATPQIMEYQGTRLEIPEDTLISGRSYEVICELIVIDFILARDSLKLNVRKPKFLVRLESRNQTIGLNQPIDIIAHVDIPKQFDYEIIWTCTKNDLTSCGEYKNVRILYIEEGFTEVCLVKIDLTVTAKDFKTTLTTFIQIVNNSIRSLDPEELSTWIDPTQELVVEVLLKNIRSGCTVKWSSIHNLTENEDNEPYHELDISKSNYNSIAPVFVKRDAILKELAPYTTEPGNQRIRLRMKPEYLKQDEDCRYLIRLETGCDGRSAINADLELSSNAAPILLTNLEVSPSCGIALTTIFRFETTPAVDKLDDLPLTYNFGWTSIKDVNQTTEVTYFSKFQGFHMAETVLPYNKETNGLLFSFLKLCDNKDSCRILQGPTVEVMMPELPQANDAFKERIFADLASNDFDKFSFDILLAFKTYKSLTEEKEVIFDDLQNVTNSMLNEKIKSFLGKPQKRLIYEMITSLRKIQAVFRPSWEVQKCLIKLRGWLINEKMSNSIVTEDEINALDVIQRISDKNINDISIEDIRKYFETTEFLITTTDDRDLAKQEKDNFIKNIDKYLGETCVLLYLDMDKKMVKFSFQNSYIMLEKFTSMYFRNFKYLPNANNEWNSYIQIMLNQTWFMDVQDKAMCIAKGMFRGYLDYEGVLYFAKLYTNDMLEVNLKKQTHTIMKSSMETSTHECSVYSDGSWQKCRKSLAKSNNLSCMCDKMGYYKIEEANNGANDSTGNGDTGNNPTQTVGGTTGSMRPSITPKLPESGDVTTTSSNANQDGVITTSASITTSTLSNGGNENDGGASIAVNSTQVAESTPGRMTTSTPPTLPGPGDVTTLTTSVTTTSSTTATSKPPDGGNQNDESTSTGINSTQDTGSKTTQDVTTLSTNVNQDGVTTSIFTTFISISTTKPSDGNENDVGNTNTVSNSSEITETTSNSPTPSTPTGTSEVAATVANSTTNVNQEGMTTPIATTSVTIPTTTSSGGSGNNPGNETGGSSETINITITTSAVSTTSGGSGTVTTTRSTNDNQDGVTTTIATTTTSNETNFGGSTIFTTTGTNLSTNNLFTLSGNTETPGNNTSTESGNGNGTINAGKTPMNPNADTTSGTTVSQPENINPESTTVSLNSETWDTQTVATTESTTGTNASDSTNGMNNPSNITRGDQNGNTTPTITTATSSIQTTRQGADINASTDTGTNNGGNGPISVTTDQSITSNTIRSTSRDGQDVTSSTSTNSRVDQENELTTNLGRVTITGDTGPNNSGSSLNPPPTTRTTTTERVIDSDEVAVEGGSDGDDVSDIETTENVTGNVSNIATRDETSTEMSVTSGQGNPTTPLESSGNSGNNTTNTTTGVGDSTNSVDQPDGSSPNQGRNESRDNNTRNPEGNSSPTTVLNVTNSNGNPGNPGGITNSSGTTTSESLSNGSSINEGGNESGHTNTRNPGANSTLSTVPSVTNSNTNSGSHGDITTNSDTTTPKGQSIGSNTNEGGNESGNNNAGNPVANTTPTTVPSITNSNSGNPTGITNNFNTANPTGQSDGSSTNARGNETGNNSNNPGGNGPSTVTSVTNIDSNTNSNNGVTSNPSGNITSIPGSTSTQDAITTNSISTNANTNGSNSQSETTNNRTTNSQNPTTQLPLQTTTSNIRSAGITNGSFLSLGDQISFVVIGLCILGTFGLILFGILSKRVRRIRAEESLPTSFPVYADIFHKENMHGVVSSR